MPHPLVVMADLARQGVRTAAYLGLGELTSRRIRALAPATPRYRPSRPVPSQRALVAEAMELIRRDARLVADGICPPFVIEEGSPLEWLDRIRLMLADVPDVARRFAERAGQEVAHEAQGAASLPGYYLQNFHYQSGGYLTEHSARLYDVQVESLFMGTASLMRRQALRPIAEHLRGRDQRRMRLLDVACGTGRFVGQIAAAFPRLPVTALDLSRSYLAEAERHLAGRGKVSLVAGKAEELPFADASQDVVVSIFLFHELPAPVRRRVAAEMARVTKPGGLVVVVDSLQWGDRPDLDGLLETFPERFHEPYYRHYLEDALEPLLEAAGLAAQSTSTAFLSKIVARRKPG